MRRVYITGSQQRMIEEAQDLSLPITVNMPAVNLPNTQKLLQARYESVKSYFSDDITSYSLDEVKTKMNKLMALCIKKEEKIRPQLEKLCSDTVIEALGVPQDAVELECVLKNSIDSKTTFHISPDTNEEAEYDDASEWDNSDGEVQKRKLLMCLSIGASMSVGAELRKSIIEKIFDLDEDLPHLYSKVMKINEYLLMAEDVVLKDEHHSQGGFVKTILGNEKQLTKIHSEAIIFPILLNETLRGFFELFLSHGLPDSADEARNIINKADVLEDEPWHMRIGPEVWKRMVYSIGEIDTEDLPWLLQNMSKLPYSEISTVFKNIVLKTNTAHQMMSDFIMQARSERKKEDFDKTLMQKQDDRSMIEDGYFTEEELR